MPHSHKAAPNIDDILLDVVTSIELSDRDRRVADSRYKRLKTHLERPQSPLARYLTNSENHIYPQGSVAIGAVVVNGTDEDRFDLDALVEMDVPSDWPCEKPLDLLYEALEDFPDVVEVVRCTRCVQLRFAFMHMDVTILDPKEHLGLPRAGEIFHSPDKGPASRVPANPFGFSQWFRNSVQAPSKPLMETLAARRAYGVDRLTMTVLEKAEQHDLPDVIPPRMDSEQVLALKLLKRYINHAYVDEDTKRPPSIYLSKLAIDIGLSEYGLCDQLLTLADHVQQEMARYRAAAKAPNELNPSYHEDRLNDRWPTDMRQMKLLEEKMDHLQSELEEAMTCEASEIFAILTGLFGEKIMVPSIKAFMERAAKSKSQGSGQYTPGTGGFTPASAVLAPAVAKASSNVTPHNFHAAVMKKDDPKDA